MASHGGDGRWLLARVDIVVLLLLQVRIGVFFFNPMQLIQVIYKF
ncbi:hypothetical protein HanRHA438_Chr10g0450801 [Helianthus annuus]|nr:hypothetical protein HanPI659440_Chr10g0377741 [Helianthus annuus]KAJ0879383.1 hypothetical protein HanRHA438_Chr10g0450801 [Helianthus annuus]